MHEALEAQAENGSGTVDLWYQSRIIYLGVFLVAI